MDPHITIVTLGVSDLARSIVFYRDGLGLPRRGEHDDIAFFRLKGTWLALYGRDALAEDANVPPNGSGFSGITLAHNVAAKEDVDSMLAQAQAAGATITKPGQDASWGGYSGYFSDPDGYLWEVAWNPEFDFD